MKKRPSNTKHEKSKPVLFSEHFGVAPERLLELGVFDPILNLDTQLFVDPVLLKNSTHESIRKGFDTYRRFFSELILLIHKSEREEDKCWREAKRRVNFPEYKFTCIGYGADSIDGSGSGAALNDQILKSAKEILDFAQDSPDIFLLLPLLEEGIGADRISDMTQNIIDEDICAFTVEAMEKLGLKGNCEHTAREGKRYYLLQNPFSQSPIKLLPLDILSDLPTAENIDGWLVNQVSVNQSLRDQVNRIIGISFEEATKKEKKQTLLNALKTDKAFFLEVLEALKEYSFEHYDLEKDAKGLYRWLNDSKELVASVGNTHFSFSVPSQQNLLNCVEKNIGFFRRLIEEKGIWRMFWTQHRSGFKHVNEFYSHMIFYMCCERWLSAANLNIKISRKANKDTKHTTIFFSWEEKYQVGVLIKHSDNKSLERSYNGESILSGAGNPLLYLVMNFSSEEAKQLVAIKAAQNPHCRIIEIDVTKEKLEDGLFFKDDIVINAEEICGPLLIGFEDLDLLNDDYKEEKRRGGRSSHKKYQPLREKVKELCAEEMKKNRYPSALKLCHAVAKLVENKHKDLLKNFQPYKNYLKDGTDWRDRTFYEWCKTAFKSR